MSVMIVSMIDDRGEPGDEEHQEELYDERLEETFPASDPVRAPDFSYPCEQDGKAPGVAENPEP
jgi:hypothetical protein